MIFQYVLSVIPTYFLEQKSDVEAAVSIGRVWGRCPEDARVIVAPQAPMGFCASLGAGDTSLL